MITRFPKFNCPKTKVADKPQRVTYSRLVHDLKDDRVDSIALRTNSRDAVYMDSSGTMNEVVSQNEEFWRVITQSSADVELVEPSGTVLVSIVLTWLLVFLVGPRDRSLRGAVTPWKS